MQNTLGWLYAMLTIYLKRDKPDLSKSITISSTNYVVDEQLQLQYPFHGLVHKNTECLIKER